MHRRCCLLVTRMRSPPGSIVGYVHLWILQFSVFSLLHFNMWPGSSVGIATELQAGRSGIEWQWGRDFPPVQTGPGAHPASCKLGTGFFPRLKCGRGVLLTTHPLLVPRSWKSRAIPLPTLWATPACNGTTLPLPLQFNIFALHFPKLSLTFYYKHCN